MSDRALWFVVPGDLDTRTGGYGYDREIIAGLRTRGWEVHAVTLPGEYPAPSDDDRQAAARALAAIPDSALVVVDGLAFGVLPEPAEREHARLRLIALVHHPLALETGIGPARAERLHASERQALASARGVVVTSTRTVSAVEALGVARERIAVVEPGTHIASPAGGSPDATVGLLCVASLVPRKGHDTLFEALSQLGELDWRLVCVGALDRDRPWVRAVQDLCALSPLAGRIVFAGELEGEALESAYHAADLFVLATRYEGYGMVVAEALARGIPIVSTPTGAIADLVDADAGVLVPADDVTALADVLRRLLSDRAELARLKGGARASRARLASWPVACEHMEEALVRLSRL